MINSILLSAQELHDLRETSDCVLVDCRFTLDNPTAGFDKYLESHIPGAVYAHLDDDLSSPITNISGRHPLPDTHKFASFLSRSGWQPGTVLVAYDDAGGAIAARLWWLMTYFGHEGSAMLDGGLSAWRAEGYALENGRVTAIQKPTAAFKIRNELVMSTSDIQDGLDRKSLLLADARARIRFMGDVEPIDSVAGHIPGSVNYPFENNLTPVGTFKPVTEIRTGLQTLIEGDDLNELVHMCGSGVTACQNIFAAELAGITGSKLYVGSWSEWIRDTSRAVEP
jgi:thiosulfate/3-mercaptopyruvate sulfurtransferase